MQVSGPSEEEVLQAVSNYLANELEDFNIKSVEVLVENTDFLINETQGVLN